MARELEEGVLALLRGAGQSLSNCFGSASGERNEALVGWPAHKGRRGRRSVTFTTASVKVAGHHHVRIPVVGNLWHKEPTNKHRRRLAAGESTVLPKRATLNGPGHAVTLGRITRDLGHLHASACPIRFAASMSTPPGSASPAPFGSDPERAVASTGPRLENLVGVIPILVTPFTASGEVDLVAIDREVEFLIGAGVAWAGFGFGSEVHRLSNEQLGAAVSRAVSTAAGRLGVFGNVEMRSIAAGIEQARLAAGMGVELVLVRPGPLAGIAQDAIVDAFAAVASFGGLPIVVQDAPQNTGGDLAPSTLARLLREVPGVAAVKIEPAAPARKIGMVLDELGGAAGKVIGGAGGAEYLQELARGACGTMPGPATPELFAAVTRLHATNEREQAFELFSKVAPLLLLCRRDMDTFLFVQKHVLVRRGVLETAHLGQPHTELDPRLPGEIDELLVALRLLELFSRCQEIGR